MSVCNMDGCWKDVYAKGLCGMHYKRELKHGDPSISLKEMRTTIPEPIIYADYAEILLTRNALAIVDLADLSLVVNYFWHLSVMGYPARRSGNKVINMHQDFIQAGEGFEIDHIDRNKLNNRRTNLRTVSHQDNMLNSITHHERLGISIDRTHNRYKAYLDSPYQKRINIGTFRTREEAEEALKNYKSIKPLDISLKLEL